MKPEWIFLPVLGQVLLTIGIYLLLGTVKAKALRAGEVDLQRRALHPDAWPESVIKVNNNIRNQFEVPVLFYVVVFVTWAAQGVTPVVHLFAWSFLLSRCAHAYGHTGDNVVAVRRPLFMFGCLMVLLLALNALWVVAG